MESILREILSLISLLLAIVALLVHINTWLANHCYIQGNTAEVASPSVKKAIYKMGPRYDYRILPGGELQVNKGDGKWLRLRVE